MHVQANGIEHHLALDGPEDGPTLLLIHGLGWDHSLWAGQIETLAGLGWRVIAPDLRGMGLTEKPDAPYSIALYARDMLAIMDALGVGRFAVAGFSLGGIIVAAMLGEAAERITAAVIACCALHATPEGEAGTEAMLARAARLGPPAFAAEQAVAIFHPDWASRHPAEVERFIAWRAAMDQAALMRAFRSGYGIDYRPVLDQSLPPLRFIAADRDPFASVEGMADLARRAQGADLVVIADAGHMAPIEQRAAFDTALVEFLERSRPSLAA